MLVVRIIYYICNRNNNFKKHTIMIKTTSLKHYKELKLKGISCQLVTKADLNKK